MLIIIQKIIKERRLGRVNYYSKKKNLYDAIGCLNKPASRKLFREHNNILGLKVNKRFLKNLMRKYGGHKHFWFAFENFIDRLERNDPKYRIKVVKWLTKKKTKKLYDCKTVFRKLKCPTKIIRNFV